MIKNQKNIKDICVCHFFFVILRGILDLYAKKRVYTGRGFDDPARV